MKSADNYLDKHRIHRGIVIHVLQNGKIVIDFENFAEGGVIIYKEENQQDGTLKPLHKPSTEAQERRIQELAFHIIQVHATLLDDARRTLEKCSSYTARPVSFNDMLRGYSATDPVRNLNPNFKDPSPLSESVVRKSIEDLMLALSDKNGLFDLLQIYSFSLTHFLERRYAESLIMYWASIEACINVLWERVMEDEASTPEIGMTGKRNDRLRNSGSFTASVIVETLFLMRRISSSSYDLIQDVRTQRNKWMHKLHPVSEQQALQARQACEMMFKETFSFDLEGIISGVGGAGGGMFKESFCQQYPNKAHLFSS